MKRQTVGRLVNMNASLCCDAVYAGKQASAVQLVTGRVIIAVSRKMSLGQESRGPMSDGHSAVT